MLLDQLPLLLRLRPTCFQLEADLELVVAALEAMELVKIQAFAVRNGVTVELERSIVEQHRNPLGPVVAAPEAMELVKIQAFAVRSGAIVELDLVIVVQLNKLIQSQFRIHQ
jgi:uncharacterized protein YigA (DUF484 family)